MTSNNSRQSEPIQVPKYSNDTGFDIPLSPTEPGKFDFYRVHKNNQGHNNDSMYSDNYDDVSTKESAPIRWTLFPHMKHLSDQPKTSSTSALFYSPKKSLDDTDHLTMNNKTQNKPIQSVASFSSLTDAVKNAMQRGNLFPNSNQLKRPASGTTLSSKDLNHLSPQSM